MGVFGLTPVSEDYYDRMFDGVNTDSLKNMLKTSALTRFLREGKFLKNLRQQLPPGHDGLEPEIMKKVGSTLLGLSDLRSMLIMPSGAPEITTLASQLYLAQLTGNAIPIFTPVCPDWSRDEQGRYDFKSLGFGVSHIVKKLIEEGKSAIGCLADHRIPYEGVIIFADWGMETEIDTTDSYGERVSPDEVVRRFSQSFDATASHLENVQGDKEGHIFRPYRLTSMTEFLSRRLGDPKAIYQRCREKFLQESGPNKLLRRYATVSFPVNRDRFGVDEPINFQMSLQTLAEYATLGEAISDGIILAGESHTASQAYNVLRPRKKKVPILFLKGKKGVDEGENIL